MAVPSALAGDFLAGPGTGSLGGPPVQHNYKRAVCRAPPALFDVDVLPPTKFGSGYCYGLRIFPITTGEVLDDMSSNRSSRSSGSMHTEYDIWRRWEDCLWFQDILEQEYALMARQKRARLVAGKGVKKNGMYIHSDEAASFDSLPPGPEANSIAKDIHEIVPKLTKKGTFFKASQATIEQRGKEFKAMIDTLWGEDVPTLVKELRETRLVRDFFGYWRRDKDHDRKIATHDNGDAMKKSRSSLSMYSRSSLTPNTLSMYFSPSTVDLSHMPASPASSNHSTAQPPRPSKSPQLEHAPYDTTASSSTGTSPIARSPITSTPTGMQFSISNRGSVTPQLHTSFSDDESSTSHRSISSARFTHSQAKRESKVSFGEMPIVFMPDGQPWSESAIYGHDRHAGLQSLPEDEELVASMDGLDMSGSPPRAVPLRRARNKSLPNPTNRNCVVFSPTPEEDAEEAESGQTTVSSSRPPSMAPSMFSDFSGASSWRSSFASESSIATISTSLPRESRRSFDTDSSGSIYSQGSTYGHGHDHRASVATMNSLVSGFSVDAVLPHVGSVKRPKSAGRAPSALSGGPISADDMYNYDYEHSDDLIDAYFYDPALQTPSLVDSAVFLTDHTKHQQPTKEIAPPERFPKPFQNRPPGQFHLPWSVPNSPDALVSSVSLSATLTSAAASPVSSPTGSDALTIKAMLDDSLIVLVRVTQATPFLEVRERIMGKFAKQEGVQLPDSFVIGYVSASERGRTMHARGRARSNSTPTPATSEALRIIASEEEWQTAVAGSSAAKLVVRILRSRS
ncbi:hypothetical protein C8Q72DRAFT_595608 [Fomitopsis betulina]|nr:hypothetical protein C8Q72DRAFT_595608 [Fomitopsis betulina]